MTTHNGKPIKQRGGAGAGRGDDPHGLTQGAHSSAFHASGTDSIVEGQPDWSSLTPEEHGYATLFNRNTATAEEIKQKYQERGMGQV